MDLFLGADDHHGCEDGNSVTDKGRQIPSATTRSGPGLGDGDSCRLWGTLSFRHTSKCKLYRLAVFDIMGLGGIMMGFTYTTIFGASAGFHLLGPTDIEKRSAALAAKVNHLPHSF